MNAETLAVLADSVQDQSSELVMPNIAANVANVTDFCVGILRKGMFTA